MKKIIFILAFMALGMGLVSCNQEDTNLGNLVNKSLSFDEFFEKVSSTEVKVDYKNNGIYINYNWNNKSNSFIITKIEEKELDFIPFIGGDAKGGGYTVSCDNGDNSWTGTCSGIRSCASLINKCLKQGGCATICENKQMVYIPQDRAFYLF